MAVAVFAPLCLRGGNACLAWYILITPAEAGFGSQHTGIRRNPLTGPWPEWCQVDKGAVLHSSHKPLLLLQLTTVSKTIFLFLEWFFLSTWISILRAPLTSPAPTINISRKITARNSKHLGDKVRQTYGSHFPCSLLPLQLKVQGVWHRICLPVPQSSYTSKSLQIIHYKLRSSHSALGFFFRCFVIWEIMWANVINTKVF